MDSRKWRLTDIRPPKHSILGPSDSIQRKVHQYSHTGDHTGSDIHPPPSTTTKSMLVKVLYSDLRTRTVIRYSSPKPLSLMCNLSTSHSLSSRTTERATIFSPRRTFCKVLLRLKTTECAPIFTLQSIILHALLETTESATYWITSKGQYSMSYKDLRQRKVYRYLPPRVRFWRCYLDSGSSTVYQYSSPKKHTISDGFLKLVIKTFLKTVS